jgi:hypothetical protein
LSPVKKVFVITIGPPYPSLSQSVIPTGLFADNLYLVVNPATYLGAAPNRTRRFIVQVVDSGGVKLNVLLK